MAYRLTGSIPYWKGGGAGSSPGEPHNIQLIALELANKQRMI